METAIYLWQGAGRDAVADAHGDPGRKPADIGPGSTSNFSLIHNVLKPGTPHT